MPRKLTTHVWVDGNWYGPDSEVPASVAKQITNPKVWDGEDDEPEESGPEVLERPAGKASREKWAAFAAQEGVEVKDNMQRDDIKSAVDAAKE